MKKILIADGGPRRNMNTAALCDAFAEGARGLVRSFGGCSSNPVLARRQVPASRKTDGCKPVSHRF